MKARQQKKEEKKRRAHTCDWPAGERLVFQLAAIRDWLQEEQVLIAFSERAVRFCGRETRSHVQNTTKTKNVEREQSRELHFHLSGEGEVNRFVLEERKKESAKTNGCLEAVLKLSKNLMKYLFFFFFCTPSRISRYWQRDSWLFFESFVASPQRRWRDSGCALLNKGSRVRPVDVRSPEMTPPRTSRQPTALSVYSADRFHHWPRRAAQPLRLLNIYLKAKRKKNKIKN